VGEGDEAVYLDSTTPLPYGGGPARQHRQDLPVGQASWKDTHRSGVEQGSDGHTVPLVTMAAKVPIEGPGRTVSPETATWPYVVCTRRT
jgi:hypothetical protein